MVYYNYRYLLTQLGRWIKRDLIEELDGNNLYQHLKNDVASFDYLGLFTDMNDLYPGMFPPGTPSRYIPNLPVPNMPGAPSPESAKKICCNDGVKVVIDDAGRQCCQNEIKIIEVRTDASIPLFHSGHTYIYIPAHGAISETGYGFHPGCEWGILGQKGEVRIDGPQKPFTQNLTYKYHACPNSIIELENKINATMANPPGWILFGTWPGSAKIILDEFLPAYNCSSMACKWLKDACFTPPCNPRTIVFPMPFGIGRGGYINE